MKIAEQNAIAIARKFIQEDGLKVGAICQIKHLPKDGYPERIRHLLDHGNWLVSFAHIGAPLTEEQKHIHPPLDGPTTVVINDETGAAEILPVL